MSKMSELDKFLDGTNMEDDYYQAEEIWGKAQRVYEDAEEEWNEAQEKWKKCQEEAKIYLEEFNQEKKIYGEFHITVCNNEDCAYKTAHPSGYCLKHRDNKK